MGTHTLSASAPNAKFAYVRQGYPGQRIDATNDSARVNLSAQAEIMEIRMVTCSGGALPAAGAMQPSIVHPTVPPPPPAAPVVNYPVPAPTYPVPQIAQSPAFEYNTDRPGSDYRNFELAAADPALCAAQCQREGQCRAWTYVIPGVQGANARCWLKHSVPNPVPNARFAVSGVMRPGGAPAAPPVQGATGPAPPAAIPRGPVIGVQTATYGQNCGAPQHNVTNHARQVCDGKSSCDYRVDYKVIGDPAPGCRKNYVIGWTCGDLQVRYAEAAPEAGFGSVVRLVCPVTGGGTGAAPVQSAAAPIAPPSGSLQTANLSSFAGRWNSATHGIITFTQSGNRVSGTYSVPGGVINATVQGRVLQGDFANNVGGFRGTVRLELAPDGRIFDGIVDGPGWSGKMNGTRAN
jgi:hypothetical protein